MLIHRHQSAHRSTFYNCPVIEMDDPSNLYFELMLYFFTTVALSVFATAGVVAAAALLLAPVF